MDEAETTRTSLGRSRRPRSRWLGELDNPGARFRLRLVSYVVVAALLPVALGSWTFARFAAARAEERADTRLRVHLQAAGGAFAEAVQAAETRAMRLAALRTVHLALARRDRAALAQLARENRNVAFFSPRGELLAGAVPVLSARRPVDVLADERRLGLVVASVPLDETLLARLRREAGLPPRNLLVIASRGRIVAARPGIRGQLDVPVGRPVELRLAGSSYRAVSTRLVTGDNPAKLVALTPAAAIEAEAAEARARVLLAGPASLAVMALIAYALAPAIARGRLALEQRTQAARVLSQVADGVFLVDRAGIVRSWNPAAEAITGLPEESVRGRPAREAVPGWAKIAPLVPVSARVDDASSRVRPRTVPLELEGRELWLSISGVEFSDGTVYAFRDVAEEQRLEESKRDFVATASHELRTPLASIYGAAMTLHRDERLVDPRRRGQLLSIISEQSERLAHILDEILLASELDSRSLPLAEETFDPRELAEGVVSAAAARLPEGLSIELVAPPSLPAVAGDRDKTGQVLANLIENGINYSPDGGRIEVGLEPEDAHLRFSVRDEGLGIPSYAHEHVFEKFYRLDPNLTRGIGGVGLGLYICRELVSSMNGTIWLESEPGVGSTFSFRLPLAGPGGSAG